MLVLLRTLSLDVRVLVCVLHVHCTTSSICFSKNKTMASLLSLLQKSSCALLDHLTKNLTVKVSLTLLYHTFVLHICFQMKNAKTRFAI